MDKEIFKKIAKTVRGLSIDAIEKANSGHPGLPLGMADVGAVLFHEFLKFNPNNPEWFNRDRFVLSGGHGSMLLYSLLYLHGYDISLDDIRRFRQWGSKTPGHPEYGLTPGVETTTGPLGQGLANAVGMAIAESNLAATYNKENYPVIDHFTYVMAGDGDLQEGVSHEACSFAGHHQLGKLIVLYDSNQITIDGDTELSFSDHTEKRFESYHWNVQTIDGHHSDEIRQAIKNAQLVTDKPSLIVCKTTIGFGSPNKAGSADSHGAPLGTKEAQLTKENLGISPEGFFVADEMLEYTQTIRRNGALTEERWQELFEQYELEHTTLAKELLQSVNNTWTLSNLPDFEGIEKMATRSASGKVLESIVSQIPGLIGGSADLTPSNKTKVNEQQVYGPENRKGKYIHYGVREFAMGGIMNGLALHGGFVPYGGTFFIFSDYMRSAIRMSALMGLRVIYVFTHDSIGVGEDGPTHQPVEQLASLQAIPNLVNIRPMDASETAVAWKMALERTDGPTSLVLTRQNLANTDRSTTAFASADHTEKGAYVLTEDENYEVILIGSGSEVETILKAKDILNNKDVMCRIVSMPSSDVFDTQAKNYKNEVLPPDKTKRIAVEAGSSMGWSKYVGEEGIVIGIDCFGASAPAGVLFEKYGFNAGNIASKTMSLIGKSSLISSQ